MLPDGIQDAGYDYKALHSIRPNDLRDQLSPVVSASPVCDGKVSKIKIPSIKQCHLRKHAFSVMVLALWNEISLGILVVLLCWHFVMPQIVVYSETLD